jgi:hypothetical protein
VAQQAKSTTAASGVQAGNDIIGMASPVTLSVSVHTPPPPPPQPSDGLARNPQVHAIPLHPRVLILDVVPTDRERGDHRRHWMPKMNSPHFNGDDAQIWLDKCLAYLALYQIPYAF